VSEVETADIRVGAGVKLTGMDVGWARLHDLQKVILWDIGPEKPKAPQRPPLPKKQAEGDPEYDLAKIEFNDQLAQYDADLRRHGQLKTEYQKWEREIGGPIELEFWSVDARDALVRDAAAVKDGRQSRLRYFVSTSTRGYTDNPNRRGERYLPNRGLPEGMSPGRGQAELARRRAVDDAELADAMRADPVFGGAHA
jgi:hypothetical protein